VTVTVEEDAQPVANDADAPEIDTTFAAPESLSSDVDVATITGWNEWTIQRIPCGEHETCPCSRYSACFLDAYDVEYSRDIEMVKGLHGDNYYYQLVQGVRRYKGVPPLPEASGRVSIDLDGPARQWDNVRPVYEDHAFETLPRNFPGVAKLHYTNTSGRNDILSCRVARDADTLYFLAETREPLTPPGGSNWMLLLLNTDGRTDTGWEGYNFVVNLNPGDSTKTTVWHNTGGWNWEPMTEVPMRVSGNRLQIAVPRAALGLEEGAALSVDFKWADNLQKPGDVMDFYISGDTAPIGRFNYRYQTED